MLTRAVSVSRALHFSLLPPCTAPFSATAISYTDFVYLLAVPRCAGAASRTPVEICVLSRC